MLFKPIVDYIWPIPKKRLYGGNKVETTWMTDHIDLAK
jgi:hypothetical protein